MTVTPEREEQILALLDAIQEGHITMNEFVEMLSVRELVIVNFAVQQALQAIADRPVDQAKYPVDGNGTT